jgi:nucleotide-binding universal stress UspA family protein
MYKHILIPTDGSRVSEEAAAAGIELARVLGARVTARHVVPESGAPSLDRWAHGKSPHAAIIAAIYAS